MGGLSDSGENGVRKIEMTLSEVWGQGERGVAGRWCWGCGGCERRVADGSRAPERR